MDHQETSTLVEPDALLEAVSTLAKDEALR